MPSRYAADTEVPADRSRAEIERTLVRYEANDFAYGWKATQVTIGFTIAGRHVKIDVPMPDRSDRRFTHHTRGLRTPAAAEAEYERATRQRWRALALVIKAKLEAVASGISTVEREFLADTMMPNGQTVHEWTAPAIVAAYASTRMPELTAR